MKLQVELEGVPPHDYQWELNTDLFFEDRKRVDEKFQSILTTKHSKMSPPTVSMSNPTASIEFRIEKVSKNFASQKFRLRIKPKLVIPPGLENQIPEGTGELNELYSRPIDSRSRPTSSSRARSSSPRPRKRARTGRSVETNDAIWDNLDKLYQSQKTIQSNQKTIQSMLSVLYQCVTRLGAVEKATEANHQIMLRRAQSLADAEAKLESSAAGPATLPGAKVPDLPKVEKQLSFTTLCLKGDNDSKFPVPVHVPDGSPQIDIPPVVRQYSQQYLSAMGDGPHILPPNKHFPARIASGDLELHLSTLMETHSTNTTAQKSADSSRIQ